MIDNYSPFNIYERLDFAIISTKETLNSYVSLYEVYEDIDTWKVIYEAWRELKQLMFIRDGIFWEGKKVW